MTVEIQKGIPMPSNGMGEGRKRKYPWTTMEVGDSFVYGGKTPTGNLVTYSSARYAPKQFAQRKMLEGGKMVIRVWRIA